jgi:hypothetical protein
MIECGAKFVLGGGSLCLGKVQIANAKGAAREVRFEL